MFRPVSAGRSGPQPSVSNAFPTPPARFAGRTPHSFRATAILSLNSPRASSTSPRIWSSRSSRRMTWRRTWGRRSRNTSGPESDWCGSLTRTREPSASTEPTDRPELHRAMSFRARAWCPAFDASSGICSRRPPRVPDSRHAPPPRGPLRSASSSHSQIGRRRPGRTSPPSSVPSASRSVQVSGEV